MSMRVLMTFLMVAWVAVVAMPVGLGAQATKGGNPKAAAVKNPVPSTPASITKGRQVYSRACRHCHGLRGKGDGPLAPKSPAPADLTDATWTYGATDGEIFQIIANGVGGSSEMKGVRSEVSVPDMWAVVNFIRSIGPQGAK
jgi:mono/diheme cytochrome c family protein